MSRVGDLLATSQSLSISGFEEASRFDRPNADLGDLLVALVQEPGAAGQSLRAAGLTLESARAAIAATHADELRGVGVNLPTAQRGPNRPDRMRGMDWSPRVLRVFKDAPTAEPFSLSLLNTLLAEPSGLIVAILTRADVDVAALKHLSDSRAALSRLDAPAGHHLQGSGDAFVAADIARVWSWLTLPESTARWAYVAPEMEPTDEPDTWSATAAEFAPDRSPMKLTPSTRRRRLHRQESVAPATVRWEMSFPDDARANSQRVTFDLAPAVGGTRVTVTVQWVRNLQRRPSASRIVAPLARPIVRRSIRFQARLIGNAIAAHFADQ